jgi:hypothetical protein
MALTRTVATYLLRFLIAFLWKNPNILFGISSVLQLVGIRKPNIMQCFQKSVIDNHQRRNTWAVSRHIAAAGEPYTPNGNTAALEEPT